ncbi:hypothetical protein C8R43DRAFT_986672 [Mycena crocata]|nr:hypothetical protein C8R43DRAFT_986672 [Mycena crocata]
MPAPTPLVTGYYKYTDIWYKVLPACDRDPLKGVLAHDALVHPDNPLHTEGIEGISLFKGTFPDGESRLLFSSRQIDYIRLWLKEMGLTREIIPLPHSDCLLTPSELSAVSPSNYRDGSSLHDAVKVIDKENKRLKGSHPRLLSRRDAFERVRTFWAAKTGTWCALDFESWERENTLITEFGYSAVHWHEGKEVEDRGHFVVAENKSYRNGNYVADNRDNYRFGKSVDISLAALKRKISKLVTDMHNYGPVYLVFHDPSQDLKLLKLLGAPVEAAVAELPNETPSEGIFIVDSAMLFGALMGEGNNTRSLEQVCNHLRVEVEEASLHNAGNDAHFTLLALREMASGETLETQRERRWPNQTGTGGKPGVMVDLTPYDKFSDSSDEEDSRASGPYNTKTGFLKESL